MDRRYGNLLEKMPVIADEIYQGEIEREGNFAALVRFAHAAMHFQIYRDGYREWLLALRQLRAIPGGWHLAEVVKAVG